ncbi:MAG: hypothetical protein IKW88_03005 [Clostridiales bacterium]|nr:hypothetical protein [Clostridiales bacterium]
MDKDILLDMIANPDNYSKDEFYDAFVAITEQYLDELISNMNYEKDIIEILGEEKGNQEIEKIATSDPDLMELEEEISEEEDPVKRINMRFDYIDG